MWTLCHWREAEPTSLGYGKRHGIAISVKPGYLHKISADLNVDLFLRKANDGKKASEEWQGDEEQSEQTDRSKWH